MNVGLEFRIWDIANKKWIKHGWTNDTYQTEYFIDVNGGVRELNYDSLDIVENVILQQYTGLQDKNGKKIFDGDILKIVCTGTILLFCTGTYFASVCWDDRKLGWFLKIVPNTVDKYKRFNSDFCVDSYRSYEVVGNVFENPDLLK